MARTHKSDTIGCASQSLHRMVGGHRRRCGLRTREIGLSGCDAGRLCPVSGLPRAIGRTDAYQVASATFLLALLCRRSARAPSCRWFGCKTTSSSTPLAYLSFSHHQAYVSGWSDLSLDCNDGTCNTITSFSGGGSLSGTGIGLGMQTTFEKIWFLRVEVESIRFNRFNTTRGDPSDYTSFSSESLHPKSTVGRMMVGYRF
jgi:hypothetical protein